MSKKPRLELTWIGKENRPRLEPRILLEDPERSYHARHRVSDKDIFDNILIQGDNLLALKALEQQFRGQVKCIFIDPPYNTGSAFIHYDDALEHSIWLSMMRDRLELLRGLLRPDGSIWITIDDNEAHYLKVLCDDVFGRSNFVANVVWQKRFSPNSTAQYLSDSHDHVIVFAQDKQRWQRNLLPRDDKHNRNYKNPDNDPRGPWTSGDLSARNSYSAGIYPVTTPSGREIPGPPKGMYWRVSKPKLLELDKEGRVWWGAAGDNVPRLKRFLSDVMEGTFGFTDFDLQNVDRIAHKPVSQELMVQQLRDNGRESIGWEGGTGKEPRLENYIVRELKNHNEVDYDTHAPMLFKLAGQVVQHLRSYLPDDQAIENVLIYFQRPLGDFVWVQMEQHLWESPTDYRAQISRGFTLLRAQPITLPPGEIPRNFRTPLAAGTSIRQVVFTGFKRCCYGYQRFHSAEGEQRLAMVLEDDKDVLRWMKPGPGQFQIEWKSGRQYEPDFVVETVTEKLILEPKRRDELDDPEVQQKAKAAARWCAYASEHAKEHKGKAWRYALVPHDAVHLGATVTGLADRYGVVAA